MERCKRKLTKFLLQTLHLIASDITMLKIYWTIISPWALISFFFSITMLLIIIFQAFLKQKQITRLKFLHAQIVGVTQNKEGSCRKGDILFKQEIENRRQDDRNKKEDFLWRNGNTFVFAPLLRMASSLGQDDDLLGVMRGEVATSHHFRLYPTSFIIILKSWSKIGFFFQLMKIKLLQLGFSLDDDTRWFQEICI